MGLVDFDARGRITAITPRAETLLRVFFAGAMRQIAAGRLPAALVREVGCAGLAKRIVRHERQVPNDTGVWHFPKRDGRRLKVRCASDHQLLLEEVADSAASSAHASLGLTAREGEVLSWVAEAKTNWEIGRILGISENTVGKHMEKVLAKLGVPNRTAAVRALADGRGQS